MRNPQMFQFLEQARKNNQNPNELINQLIGKYTPEQINQFRQFASGFGITDEQLNKYINTK